VEQKPNPFMPYMATIKSVTDLTPDVKLFNTELDDPVAQNDFNYQPGQFAFLSAYGIGEAPFCLTSAGHRKTGIEFAIKAVGTVTDALHELEEGAKVGIRGPFGNSFPMDDYKGKNIIIIGGGIGMAPLHPVINTIVDNRSDYGDLMIINGARSPQDLVFKDEFDVWAKTAKTKVELTVDRGDDDWKGRTALIPDVVVDLNPPSENAIAILCGPPIMIHFTLIKLKELGFGNDQIVTTLEGKMKCGLGKCGRCNVGDKYICVDGPVFTFEQMSQFIEQF